MKFGEKHSDKCTRQETMAFRKKVMDYLLIKKYPFTRVVALTAYGGQVKIFDGTEVSRKSRIRYKKAGEGRMLRTNEPIVEKSYTSVFMVDDWEFEKDAIDSYFKRFKWG